MQDEYTWMDEASDKQNSLSTSAMNEPMQNLTSEQHV